MLYVTIPAREDYDEAKQEFIYTKEQKLQLEHSLVSISKWESKWHKPFLSDSNRTIEETIDYIRCMTITQNVDPEVYNSINSEVIEQVNAYIANPMTATWFTDNKMPSRRNNEAITNELIYYWMTSFNIPFNCEKWHLNRLLTLIRICNIKNQPSRKMSGKETSRQYAALNKARRQRLNSRG